MSAIILTGTLLCRMSGTGRTGKSRNLNHMQSDDPIARTADIELFMKAGRAGPPATYDTLPER